MVRFEELVIHFQFSGSEDLFHIITFFNDLTAVFQYDKCENHIILYN